MGALTNQKLGDLVLSLRDLIDTNVFIETGTYMGESSEWASSRFEDVITIEAARELWENARAKFKDTNVRCFCGDSRGVIERILHDNQGVYYSPLFWLDAHWSGGITAGIDEECPLIDELNIIKQYCKNYVILIDDARLFISPPPPPHKADHWPSLDDIQKVFGGDMYIYEDAIIIVPDGFRDYIENYIRDNK